jgi:RNA exonuclease 1
MGFINAHTILIGHGLENDLRALKLVHTTLIDTSIVFPHYYGLPYRRSLKSLVKSYLKREIQVSFSPMHYLPMWLLVLLHGDQMRV